MRYEKATELLSNHLQKRGWPGTELARQLDTVVHRSTVSRWLTGETRPGTPELVAEIARVLQMDRDLLLASYGYGVPQDTTPPLGGCVPIQSPPRAEHFIGRQEELTKLVDDLQPGNVITIWGPGGIGKTALAAEAVHELTKETTQSKRFPDGIFFYSFYNDGRTAVALEQIARSFGEEFLPTIEAAAQRALLGKRALLILDGAEAADNLNIVLDIRDRCGILITSRRREDRLKERQALYPLQDDDAVNLLKAWGEQPLSDDKVLRCINEIVGGLPLALCLIGRYLDHYEEEAADYLAWLEQTPLAALDRDKRRMDSVPYLLERSLRQVCEPAHRVMAAIGLLALAPFQREHIVEPLGLSIADKIKAFGDLVNYGLLYRKEKAYEVSHPLIHTYARERLRVSTEIADRIALYYADLAHEKQREGPTGYPWLKDQQAHLMNILKGCVERENWKAALNLTWAVEDYLRLQGFWPDRVIALEAGLTAARALLNPFDEVSLLGHLGSTCRSLGRMEEAFDYYQHAVVLAQRIGDRESEGNWVGSIGLAHAEIGQNEQAIDYYKRGLAMAQETGNRYHEESWLGTLGAVCRETGQIHESIEYCQQALAIAQEINRQDDICRWEGGLGTAYHILGQVEVAMDHYYRALEVAQKIGFRRGELRLGHLGIAYQDLGNFKQAIEYHQQALAITQEIGFRRGEGICLGNLGNAYCGLGYIEQAIHYYQQALSMARRTGNLLNESIWLGKLGLAYHYEDRVPQAIEYHQQALELSTEIRHQQGEGVHWGHLGLVYDLLGEAKQAIDCYQLSLTIAQKIGHRFNEVAALHNSGMLYQDQTKPSLAQNYLERSSAIAMELEFPFQKKNERIEFKDVVTFA